MATIANEQLVEAVGVISRVAPQTVTAAATAQSDVVDMQKFDEVVFIFNFGNYAAGNDGVVNGGIYWDTASGGAFTNAVTGKTITAASFSGSAQDDQVAVIGLRVGELIRESQSARYVRAKATPTNQDMLISVIGIGISDHRPSNQYDLAAVAQLTKG